MADLGSSPKKPSPLELMIVKEVKETKERFLAKEAEKSRTIASSSRGPGPMPIDRYIASEVDKGYVTREEKREQVRQHLLEALKPIGQRPASGNQSEEEQEESSEGKNRRDKGKGKETSMPSKFSGM